LKNHFVEPNQIKDAQRFEYYGLASKRQPEKAPITNLNFA